MKSSQSKPVGGKIVIKITPASIWRTMNVSVAPTPCSNRRATEIVMSPLTALVKIIKKIVINELIPDMLFRRGSSVAKKRNIIVRICVGTILVSSEIGPAKRTTAGARAEPKVATEAVLREMTIKMTPAANALPIAPEI